MRDDSTNNNNNDGWQTTDISTEDNSSGRVEIESREKRKNYVILIVAMLVCLYLGSFE